jgi:hypothetical protein
MNSRRRIITNVVRLPEAKEVPRDVRPIPDVFVGSGLTIGFLLDAVKTGKLDPPSGPIPPELEPELRLRLGVAQREEGQPVRCRQVTGPLNLRPAKGAEYGITTPVTMFAHRAARLTSRAINFNPSDGHTLTIELPDLDLRLTPVQGASFFTLCSIA